MRIQNAMCMRLVLAAAIALAGLSTASLHADQVTALDATVLKGARFALFLGDVEIASFTRFDSSVDPASAFAPVISLSGGQTHSPELNSWHEAARFGHMDAARRNCTIVMYNGGGSAVQTYSLVNAWPKKYTGVGGRALLTEAVMLEYESVEVRRD